MTIGKISFILENCEIIDIDGKYIGTFLIDNINTTISRMACNWIGKMVTANTVVIEIHKDANKSHNPFGDKKYNTNKFQRLTQYSDITQIEFNLIDQYAETEEEKKKSEEQYMYFVNWDADEDYDNPYQKTLISDSGNLYLVIDKNKDISDFFDIEDINDEEAMDFHFSMCDVGDKYSDPNRYNDDAYFDDEME